MARKVRIGDPTSRDIRILKKLEDLILAKGRKSPDQDIMWDLRIHFKINTNELCEAIDRLTKSGHYRELQKKFELQKPPKPH